MSHVPQCPHLRCVRMSLLGADATLTPGAGRAGAGVPKVHVTAMMTMVVFGAPSDPTLTMTVILGS